MRRIPNIKLTEQDFERIKQSSHFDYGSEADIYKTDNPNTLYKIFTHPYADEIIDMSDNKLKKIVELYQMELEHIVRPLRTITMNGRLIGYEMTYDRDDQEFRYVMPNQDREERLYWLEHTRDILEYFHSRDITFGDVASRNILVNYRTGQAKFCDIDNICIGEYPIDIVPDSLKRYRMVRGIDEQIDAYGHNLMTADALYINSYDKLRPIRQLRFKGALIYYSMQSPQTFGGEYIVQYVKKK